MPTNSLGPAQFASSVLHGLGIAQTPGAVRGLVGWMKAEGGHYNNDARYNPLNTTQPMPGAGNTGSQGNIKVYRNWQQGIEATVKTLKNGRYQPILQALQAGNAGRLAQAVGQTPWGTSAALVSQTIAGTPEIRGAQPAAGTLSSRAPTVAPTTTTTPGIDNSAQRAQLVQQFLGRSHQDPLQFAIGIRGLQDTAPTTQTTPAAGQPTATLTGGGLAPGHGASNALAWAASKIGNQETGTNSGGLASYANARFGMANQPWCAMFTSLAVTKGGAPSSARTASVADVLQKAQAGDGYHKGFIDPAHAQPGDLIAFGTSHIGMVQSVHNGKVTMIAGNDSNKVQRRDVILGGDARIVRPAYGHKP